MRDAEAGRTVPAEEVRRLLAEVRQADREVKSGHYIKARGHEGVAVVMGNQSRVAGSEVRLQVVRILNVPK
jgi:hypothetical protein